MVFCWGPVAVCVGGLDVEVGAPGFGLCGGWVGVGEVLGVDPDFHWPWHEGGVVDLVVFDAFLYGVEGEVVEDVPPGGEDLFAGFVCAGE